MKHIALGAYLLSGTPGYRQAGVHQYAKALLHNLPPSPELRYTALISPTAVSEMPEAPAVSEVIQASRTTEAPFSRIRVEQYELPRLLRALPADLYHGLGFVLPLRIRLPSVVTVFDLSFITHPGAHKVFNRTYLSLFTRWSCRRATRVITISEATKRDVVNHFGLPPDRVDAIPLGASERFTRRPADAIRAFKAGQGIGDRAIFYLGSLEPRKNLPALVEAFARLAATPGGDGAQLYIAGSLGWHYEGFLKKVESLNLNDRIKLLGRLPDDDLADWMSACAVFAYPSLYEGFGLPVLEAMRCGAPVITSATSSFPEVAGTAAILIDPADTGAIVNALARVLPNMGLRVRMSEASQRQAQRFSWQRTAQSTVATYRKALHLEAHP